MPIVLDKPPDHVRVLRDRALLTLGWGAALRVSELVGLDLEDLAMYGDPDAGTGGGVVLHINQSKTDQHGAGVDVGVPYSTHLSSCPVRSTMMLQRKLMDITNRDPLTGRRLPDQTNIGPLFRSIRRSGSVGGRLSRQSVDTLIRFYIETVLDTDPTGYSTHSLRAGFVIECSNQDVAEHKIRRTTRHTSSTGLNPYDRPTEHFNNAALASDWW